MSPSHVLDRRRFLRPAAPPWALPPCRRFAFAEDKDDPFGGFTLGVQSYTFRNFDLEQALKRIKDLGLHYVEFCTRSTLRSKAMTPEQIKAVLKLCKEYDITPSAAASRASPRTTTPTRRSSSSARRSASRCSAPTPTRTASTASTSCATSTRSPSASTRTARRGKHCTAGTRPRSSWRRSRTIIALIGTCLDTGHLIRSAQLGKKLDPAEEIRMMGARNFGMHLKDHDNKSKTDVVFGKGVLDVPARAQGAARGQVQGARSASSTRPTRRSRPRT